MEDNMGLQLLLQAAAHLQSLINLKGFILIILKVSCFKAQLVTGSIEQRFPNSNKRFPKPGGLPDLYQLLQLESDFSVLLIGTEFGSVETLSWNWELNTDFNEIGLFIQTTNSAVDSNTVDFKKAVGVGDTVLVALYVRLAILPKILQCYRQDCLYQNISLLSQLQDSFPNSIILVYIEFDPGESSSSVESDANFYKALATIASFVPFHGKVYVIQMAGPTQPTRLWEVYNIKKVTFVRKLHVEKLDLSYSLTAFASRRQNLHLVDFIGTAVVDPTNAIMFDVQIPSGLSNGTAHFVGGYAINLYWDLRDSLNFTEKALAGDYIDQESYGEFTGMGKQVLSGEADIGVSFAYLMTYRAAKLVFTNNIYSTRPTLVFRQPEARFSRNIYTGPFQSPLWWTLFATFVSLIILMHYCKYYVVRRYCINSEDYWFPDEASIWALGVLCQQGWYKAPVSTNLRMVFYVMVLTGFVLYISYAAKIIANLSTEIVPIKTIPDFFAKHYLKLLDDSLDDEVANSMAKFYALPLDFVKNRIIKVTKTDEQTLSYNIKRTVNLEASLITTSDRFFANARNLNLSQDMLCDIITFIPIEGLDSKFSMFLKKGSPFKEIINFKSLMIKERGLNFRYLTEIWRKTVPKCNKKRQRSYYQENLGLAHVLPADVMLLLGILSSPLILLLETVFRLRFQLLSERSQ